MLQPNQSNPNPVDTEKHRAAVDITQEILNTNDDADIIEHLLINKLDANHVNKMNNN